MSVLKKTVLSAASALMLAALLVGNALACSTYYPYYLGSISETLKGATYTTSSSSALSGTFNVTPLGFETSNTITLMSATGAKLFTNTNSADYSLTKSVTNLAGATFAISNQPTVGMSSSQVTVLELTKDWTFNNKLITAGTLIIGLEDTPNESGGYDYNDYILTATKAAATPIPGAVILLGSGLFGLAGFKRVRKGS